MKYGVNGCPSEEFIINIGKPQEVTVPLLYEVEQPECESLVGTIFILNEEALNYTVRNTGTNFTFYDNVSYPATGFTDLPPGEYLITGISENGCISGSVVISLNNPDCQVAEGCTLGYWKNHTDRWCDAYQTCTVYGEVFENAPSALADLTLLEVLNLGGGGINNLGRQSVAALLNTCSSEVEYYYTNQLELIAYVNSNFSRRLAGAAGTYLDELNNAGCPLGGTQATSEPSEGCDPDDSDNENNGSNGKGNNSVAISGFTAYPVPFKETLNIQYEFDYVSPATIQFFDMRGRLLRSVKELKATRGVITTIEIDYTMRPSQTYIVKVITNREVITKQIVSSK
ncbi:T9SS type A sorting domain-containing protein [Antarcticibacterium sp. 1MA-6-2]|uniref:T9SS type A sorting domain-containing protein n=1 Tax=Antarcticibacterium sp. 1MA-6-2 TaxID=2908210 RepID=UPI001F239AEA|nr:T9SS type A sorting domain-containing protein [Antarcticibacterium sp. 1MA-6-2]UJH89785.1 T9SS type A sorting domain-containing protein [Antarcticibacterium sp. 1MA-6-2]